MSDVLKPMLGLRRMSDEAEPPVFPATSEYTERYPSLDSRRAALRQIQRGREVDAT